MTLKTAPKQIPSRRRTSPLLIKQWKYLWRQEYVEISGDQGVIGTGWIDEVTADGSTIWVHLSHGHGRVMLHRDDKVDIWRIDAKICQNYDPEVH